MMPDGQLAVKSNFFLYKCPVQNNCSSSILEDLWGKYTMADIWKKSISTIIQPNYLKCS